MAGKNVTIVKAAPSEEEVRLFDPRYAGFSFGPGGRGSTIDFGPRGGFEPHVAIVRRDHPLLDELLRARPDIVEGSGDAGGGTVKVYVCHFCSREVGGLIGLQSHLRTHRSSIEGSVTDVPKE